MVGRDDVRGPHPMRGPVDDVLSWSEAMIVAFCVTGRIRRPRRTQPTRCLEPFESVSRRVRLGTLSDTQPQLWTS